jgi:hypothetical protein
MEIPGLSPLSGQPTLTNPLPQSAQLEGRQTPIQNDSETKNTQAVSEQKSIELSTAQVVEQANKPSAVNFDRETIGSNIDLTT